MLNLNLDKTGQEQLMPLIRIFENFPQFLNQIGESISNYNLGEDVNLIVQELIGLKKDNNLDELDKRLKAYKTYYSFSDQQKERSKKMIEISIEDPDVKRQLTSKYYNPNIKTIPEEDFVVKYIFKCDELDQESIDYPIRDYSNSKGITAVVSNIILGEYVRKVLHIKDGIVNEYQKEAVYQSFGDYCVLRSKELVNRSKYLIDELVYCLDNNTIEQFEEKYVMPALCNLPYSEILDMAKRDEDDSKGPYNKAL